MLEAVARRNVGAAAFGLFGRDLAVVGGFGQVFEMSRMRIEASPNGPAFWGRAPAHSADLADTVNRVVR